MELLVIDDGSAVPIASHPKLADLFADPRVTLIRLERNNGLVFGLNTGLNLARHELIARIDSDDAWRPGKLTRQLALFGADPDLTISGTGMRLVHTSGNEMDVDLIRPGSWEGVLKFTASVGCPFPHGSILARRDLFWLLGGYSHDPATAHCEDFALWALWLRFFKVAMVEEVLYDYTVSDQAISAVHAPRQRAASGTVHAAFLATDWEAIPEILHRLADYLGLSLLETGRACFTAWRFGDPIVADPEIVSDLHRLMPDRQVIATESARRHLGGRFFYLSKRPEAMPPGSRRIAGITSARNLT
ncbi:glycosyltransferase [Desulfatitalea sp. M08but]|uniref:Glycosyltransferase n=2 Tax=Desulfatitalea alkaliphila TaxID=2929485 RepID=A0AA41UHU8_9BACT|nr:glycosyltransferase [Desulfatitalea alkaliphila]